MCVACIEFIKGTLTPKEFRSALKETTRDDESHLREVERTLGRDDSDADTLRQKLRESRAKP